MFIEKGRRYLAIVLVVAASTLTGTVGNREGNGGDHVRATFIRMGQAVLHHLENTEAGAAFVAVKGLSLSRLREALTIHRITVVEGELRDNGGAIVDALGEPGKITLKKEAWLEHFERERDVYYLVFHELLRSADYRDDNYVTSGALLPFPRPARINTRIVPLLPLIGDELLANVIKLPDAIYHGSGCPASSPATFMDFDLERNILDITFREYTASTSKSTMHRHSRSACALSLPFRAPLGKRLIVTQIDLSGRVQLPQGTEGAVSMEIFLAGNRGPTYRKQLDAKDGDANGRFQIRNHQAFRTECGQAQLLRLNTSGRVNNAVDRPAELKVERVSLYFKVEDCV